MPPGRKPKFTKETIGKLVDAIRKGATHDLACKYAGIDNATLYRWMQEKSEFGDAIREAEGAAAFGWLSKIEEAAEDGNWKAAAWKLERRYPQDYGRSAIEVSGPDKGPVQVEITEARAKLAALMARRNEEASDPTA